MRTSTRCTRSGTHAVIRTRILRSWAVICVVTTPWEAWSAWVRELILQMLNPPDMGKRLTTVKKQDYVNMGKLAKKSKAVRPTIGHGPSCATRLIHPNIKTSQTSNLVDIYIALTILSYASASQLQCSNGHSAASPATSLRPRLARSSARCDWSRFTLRLYPSPTP